MTDDDEFRKVDEAIMRIVIPKLYDLIDRLLDFVPESEKSLIIEAKGVLPKGYKHSFMKVRP